LESLHRTPNGGFWIFDACEWLNGSLVISYLRFSIDESGFWGCGWARLRGSYAVTSGYFTIFSGKNQGKKAKRLATERALDKYKFFVFGLTIATTLY